MKFNCAERFVNGVQYSSGKKKPENVEIHTASSLETVTECGTRRIYDRSVWHSGSRIYHSPNTNNANFINQWKSLETVKISVQNDFFRSKCLFPCFLNQLSFFTSNSVDVITVFINQLCCIQLTMSLQAWSLNQFHHDSHQEAISSTRGNSHGPFYFPHGYQFLKKSDFNQLFTPLITFSMETVSKYCCVYAIFNLHFEIIYASILLLSIPI